MVCTKFITLSVVSVAASGYRRETSSRERVFFVGMHVFNSNSRNPYRSHDDNAVFSNQQSAISNQQSAIDSEQSSVISDQQRWASLP